MGLAHSASHCCILCIRLDRSLSLFKPPSGSDTSSTLVIAAARPTSNIHIQPRHRRCRVHPPFPSCPTPLLHSAGRILVIEHTCIWPTKCSPSYFDVPGTVQQLSAPPPHSSVPGVALGTSDATTVEPTRPPPKTRQRPPQRDFPWDTSHKNSIDIKSRIHSRLQILVYQNP